MLEVNYAFHRIIYLFINKKYLNVKHLLNIEQRFNIVLINAIPYKLDYLIRFPIDFEIVSGLHYFLLNHDLIASNRKVTLNSYEFAITVLNYCLLYL